MNEIKWVARCVMRVNRFTAGLNQKEILRTIMKWSPCYTNNKAFLCIFFACIIGVSFKICSWELLFIVFYCRKLCWALSDNERSGLVWLWAGERWGEQFHERGAEILTAPLLSYALWMGTHYLLGFYLPPLHRSTRNQRRDVRGN